jgi:hypothetical protein
MIRITRAKENAGVYIEITPGGPLEDHPVLDFYRAGASPMETLLLCEQLRTQLETLMMGVRRVSYRSGWRDAKSKRKKKEWFAGCAEVLNWERIDAGEEP